MIRVEPRDEPDDFDAKVRSPGHSAIEELLGREPTIVRPGPRRTKKADRVEDLCYDDLPTFWRKCLPELVEAYGRICAYFCQYVEPISGNGTVDHYVPKSPHPRAAYEWNNYRFACGRMNARKGLATEVLDPFEVEDNWFQLELVRFQLEPARGLPSSTVARIRQTIMLLGLNDERCKQTRATWFEDYFRGEITLSYLQRRFPLLGRELRRQERLRPDDLI